MNENVQEKELLEAMFAFDVEWSDPDVCRAEMERLHTVGAALLDQLDEVFKRMCHVSAKSLEAAIVASDGDMDLASDLHDDQFGDGMLDELRERCFDLYDG